MKNITVFLLNFLIAILFFALLFVSIVKISLEVAKYTVKDDRIEFAILKQKVNYLEDYIINLTPDSIFNKEWFLFKLALIQVESEFNPNAVNKSSGASGIYQIMPVYVKEANRLNNIQYSIDNNQLAIFTDSCRFDIYQSNQMFEIINKIRNSNKSFQTAIKLHNPTAGNWYGNRVMYWYNKFKLISEQL